MPPRRQGSKANSFPGSFDHAVELLGGTGKAAVRLGRTATQVCQWRARNGALFPAELFFRADKQLQREGYRADPRLFTFEPVRISRKGRRA